jgi:hypothetical protein
MPHIILLHPRFLYSGCHDYLITYYTAPNAQLLRHHYEGLPKKLQADGVDPRVPWLYGFKLDFRFK